MKRFERVGWVLALIWIVLAIWPGSYWYDAGVMLVEPVAQGEPIKLDYTGGAIRPFKGSYSVVIRNVKTHGIVSEDRSGVFQYSPDAQRPGPLLLSWWSPRGVTSSDLRVGSYYMETCWTVHRPFWGLAPNKTLCADPVIFKIRPAIDSLP